MRVLASGDNHWDEHCRWNDCVKVHDFMVDVARAEAVGLFVDSGDIYERASTPVERRGVAEWLTAMAEICPVVIAKGNHDRSFELGLLGRLRTRHPIIVEEHAGVHLVAGAAVAAVAWPNRASLAAAAGAKAATETDDAARVVMRTMLRDLGEGLAEHWDCPRIGLGHWMIDGAVVSTGQPLLGMPLNVGLEDLALLGAPLVIAGHIHRAQEWTIGESRILYTGSPYRTDFGQLEEKSVVLAEFDGPRLASVRRIATPCARMLHLDAVYEGPDVAFCRNLPSGRGFERGAEIRLRYEVATDLRDAGRNAAETVRQVLLDRGAVSVKVEEVVIPTTRARAPEIAAAATLPDKLRALWLSRGEDISQERAAKVFEKVSTIEEEASDAA